ncbi:MAG: M20/M25/M40 family metallo-hydrolase [Myxococcota bacterium]
MTIDTINNNSSAHVNTEPSTQPHTGTRRAPGRSIVIRIALACIVVMATGALLGLWWLTMPGRSWEGPPPPLKPTEEASRQRLEGHIRTLSETIGPRHMGDPSSMARTVKYIEQELKRCGYTTKRLPVDSDKGPTLNLETELRGTTEPKAVVLVGAHYDTVSRTPGADDNATGVAAVLELACLLRDTPQPRTVRFVLFTHEEPPYFRTAQMGSRVYARQARQRGDAIVAMYAFDMLGYFSQEPKSQSLPPGLDMLFPHTGNFIAFISTTEARTLVHESVRAFRAHARVPSEGLAAPPSVEGIDFSDHASFLAHDYPAVMVTDTAFMRNAHYHEPTDTLKTLDLHSLTHVVLGMKHVILDQAQSKP